MSIDGYRREAEGKIRSVRKCPKCGGRMAVEATKGSFRRRRCDDCGERFITREMFADEVGQVEQFGQLGQGMLILLTNLLGQNPHQEDRDETPLA